QAEQDAKLPRAKNAKETDGIAWERELTLRTHHCGVGIDHLLFRSRSRCPEELASNTRVHTCRTRGKGSTAPWTVNLRHIKDGMTPNEPSSAAPSGRRGVCAAGEASAGARG